MRKNIYPRFCLPLLLFLCFLVPPVPAQTAPSYEQFRLDAIFPAGGRRGETVTVELLGGNTANLSGVKSILIDGPPGITVSGLKNLSPNRVEATLVIAADAPRGRRRLRVVSERSGVSNMAYFSVGGLPETRDKEPNNDLSSAQEVALPIVINGKVDPRADVDCFRFPLKKGQKLTAAVLAHTLDSHGHGRNYGFVDPSLQILDERGRVLAEASDTLGLDPQLEFLAPADGTYTARVHLEAFEGFPQAVYRLVLGEVPLATSIFPPGGQRGSTVEVTVSGANLSAFKQKVVIPAAEAMPFRFVGPEAEGAMDLELPFVHGDFPERLEAEPNQNRDQATPLEVPMTVNGRIDNLDDEDWYRISLKGGQVVVLETTAQRFLRSPLDTLLQVFDAGGKKLAENDDGFVIHYVSMHDYRPMDSRLVFTAPAAGEYFIRVSDQAGGGGPRSVYRLTVQPAEPDFELFLYPDGVPVWGPGSTAALLVVVHRLDGMEDDITLSVEGLPAGWTAAPNVSRGRNAKPSQLATLYYFLTLTAPADAKVGEPIPFRVVGRAEGKGKKLERTALPLTWYYTSDIGLFRITPLARAAVTSFQAPWLSTPTESLRVPVGGQAEIPIQVHNADKLDKIDLSADVARSGVATALNVPQSVALRDGKGVFLLKLGPEMKPGRYGIVVALRWRSDVRIGMPGPCTRVIELEVVGKE